MATIKKLGKSIQLGDTVRDTITGFVGIAISRTEFLYSCNVINVQPVAYDETTMSEDCFFDEPQLEILCKKTLIDNNVVAMKDPTNK